MTTLFEAIEKELQSLSQQNMISLGKKITPEVVKRIAEAVEASRINSGTPEITMSMEAAERQKEAGSIPSGLPVFRKIKDLYGGLYAWQVTDEMFLEVEKQFVK